MLVSMEERKELLAFDFQGNSARKRGYFRIVPFIRTRIPRVFRLPIILLAVYGGFRLIQDAWRVF